ncbi:hypothetical protein EC973_008611 [Apophysomyces ossiformis]|uniref:Histone chaperone domain-containing protein n=1 Tax=Apophysomyces ossiformis TaxID=679940 RepID=A0A8H7BSI5_9FUNG|nr:hypothetical protein EC973_008611 [Apophysomyces ossiformis]
MIDTIFLQVVEEKGAKERQQEKEEYPAKSQEGHAKVKSDQADQESAKLLESVGTRQEDITIPSKKRQKKPRKPIIDIEEEEIAEKPKPAKPARVKDTSKGQERELSANHATEKEDNESGAEIPEEELKESLKESSKKKKDVGVKKTSADEETIKRLKSYINKCGVRKVWAKELKDCKTSKSQINKLKSMLEDLGVHGRPTIEKCQKVKAERELKAEIESLDTSNILAEDKGGRSTRSHGSKRKRRVITDEDEDDETESKKKKGDNEEGDDESMGGELDVSFLGDQSSDSE